MITEEGGKAAVVVADVTTEEGCRLALSDEPGLAPDGLVLNVGTGFGMGVAGTSPDEWDRTFALNLRSHFMLVRRALVTLRDDASIVFIGSVAGLRPGQPHPGLRRLQGGAHRPEPPRRGRGRPPRHPGQRARPRPHRHAARPSRLRRAALAHPYAGAARPPGHGVGGGGGGRLPALGRGELRHGAGARRRRGVDAGMSAHSAQRVVGRATGSPRHRASAGAWRASTVR